MTGACGNLNITVRDGAGGQIEHQGITTRARCGECDGVGAEKSGVPAAGHHAGHAVDNGKCHQPVARQRLHIGPQRRKMVRPADRQQGNAVGPRLGNQQIARRRIGRLGKAVARVHAHKARRLVLHHRLGLAVHPAALQRGHIAGDAEHAMAHGTVALRAGAVVCKHDRNGFASAVSQEDLCEHGAQLVERNQLLLAGSWRRGGRWRVGCRFLHVMVEKSSFRKIWVGRAACCLLNVYCASCRSHHLKARRRSVATWPPHLNPPSPPLRVEDRRHPATWVCHALRRG
ncbi:hypothetical protein SDC9_130999 [bioreactor metagenome]|uniref:Uncharacterized protein n=1 Tax=bioreactor metagenome TaxID=1076179 RepID=A0A645D3Z8_9ZZZZ